MHILRTRTWPEKAGKAVDPCSEHRSPRQRGPGTRAQAAASSRAAPKGLERSRAAAASSRAPPKGLERSRAAAASPGGHLGQPGAASSGTGAAGPHPGPRQAFLGPPSAFILQLGFPDGEASVAMRHTGKSGRSECPVTARAAHCPRGVTASREAVKQAAGAARRGCRGGPFQAPPHPRLNQRLRRGPRCASCLTSRRRGARRGGIKTKET